MKTLNIFVRLRMPLNELEKYYRDKRKSDYESGKRPRYIKLREKFYVVFKTVLRIDRVFRKQKITILSEKRQRFKGQYIFACTHIWENDLENIYESLGRGCWWFVGDPGFTYKDISGLLLSINGCIFTDLPFREDCHIAYLRAIDLLKAGGSLMIFPEGARNGTENLPVMKLFPGVARMSKATNVKILPIAIEQYGKEYCINYGNEIIPDEYGSEEELTSTLRDQLATLKWKIWEEHGIYNRSEFTEKYRDSFNKEFEKKLQPYDTLETNLNARYKTKEDIEYTQVLKDIQKLKNNLTKEREKL